MDEPQNTLETSDKTQQEILQERLQEQASRARAGGQQAGQAALAVWQGASSVSAKMLIVGAVLGLVSFFLPWITASLLFISASVSGYEYAKSVQSAAWFFPISMAFTLFMCWLNLHADAQRRILAARWYIAIGASWTWFWVIQFFSTRTISAGIAGVSIGGYLAAIAAILVLVGGMMQIQEYALLPSRSTED